ncbi:MAG: metallophosphoesterase family protein, partial [Candidatus Helarchaeota archaeon]
MVKIGLFSDTHLGCTVGDVRTNKTFKINKLRLAAIEYDFAKAFNFIVDKFCERKDDLDLIIHSGDFFHFPYKGTNAQLSEASRIIAGRGIKKLNELNIPIIIIDGNHGIFNAKRVSTLQQFEVFENVKVFTFWRDLIKAIQDSKPLIFKKDDFAVHCFPFVNPEDVELYSSKLLAQYKNWTNSYVLNHVKDSDIINIGLIHGMTVDKSLPSDLDYGSFDFFIAGHDHVRNKIGSEIFYPGSTEKWKFDSLKTSEKKKKRYFYVVDVEKGRREKIEDLEIPLRQMFVDSIEIGLEDNDTEILDRIKNKIQEFGLNQPFNEKTAARVKIFLEGKIGLSTWTKLSPNLTSLQKEILFSENTN